MIDNFKNQFKNFYAYSLILQLQSWNAMNAPLCIIEKGKKSK